MACDFGITYISPKIKNEVRQCVAPFSLNLFEKELRELAETILRDKPSFSLSLVFADPDTTQNLNIQHRAKDYVPNVLSFPLSLDVGEVYITLSVAIEESPRYGHTPAAHVRFLFVHGLLHCLGLDHGKKMDALEKKYIQYTEKRVRK